MDVLKALADEIRKMFAADLALSLTVVGVVLAVALGLRFKVFDGGLAPILLGLGVLIALTVGVARGARRR